MGEGRASARRSGSARWTSHDGHRLAEAVRANSDGRVAETIGGDPAPIDQDVALDAIAEFFEVFVTTGIAAGIVTPARATTRQANELRSSARSASGPSTTRVITRAGSRRPTSVLRLMNTCGWAHRPARARTRTPARR